MLQEKTADKTEPKARARVNVENLLKPEDSMEIVTEGFILLANLPEEDNSAYLTLGAVSARQMFNVFLKGVKSQMAKKEFNDFKSNIARKMLLDSLIEDLCESDQEESP